MIVYSSFVLSRKPSDSVTLPSSTANRKHALPCLTTQPNKPVLSSLSEQKKSLLAVLGINLTGFSPEILDSNLCTIRIFSSSIFNISYGDPQTDGHRRLLLREEIDQNAKLFIHTHLGKGKGKAIPLRAWTGPEGSRRLKFPDFKTIGT